MHKRAVPFAMLAIVIAFGGGCRSFGRKFNEALPEFLRSDPGASEVERYRQRARVLKRTPEEIAAAHESFLAAKALLEAGDYENASVAFEDFLEEYPDTSDDKEARFLLIKAYLGDEEFDDAKKAIKTFLSTYPITSYNDELEDIMYQLAVEYLNGEHDSFIFSSKSDGVSLLRDLVLYFPNGIHADDAQWKLGKWYYDEKDWIEAEAAYAAIVENHPDSPWAPRAQYNRGLTRFAQVKGPEYDGEIMKSALADFRLYLDRYPEGDRREKARKHVETLRELLAEKELSIGEWYLDHDWPRAARYYFAKTVDQHQGTQAAERAAQLLRELPSDRDVEDSPALPTDPAPSSKGETDSKPNANAKPKGK